MNILEKFDGIMDHGITVTDQATSASRDRRWDHWARIHEKETKREKLDQDPYARGHVTLGIGIGLGIGIISILQV